MGGKQNEKERGRKNWQEIDEGKEYKKKISQIQNESGK